MAYSTETDVNSEFGADNIARWGAVNTADDAAAITVNVTYAIATADALIDGLFQGGPYVIPFSPVPILVQRWSAKLAGAELYRKRGLRDDDLQGDKLTEIETEVWRQMHRFVSGSLRLPPATQKSHAGPTSPVVVGAGVYPGRRLDSQIAQSSKFNPYAPRSFPYDRDI